MHIKKLINRSGRALLLTVVACMGMAQVAYAATSVSGAITANTTWSLVNSPYQVTADISVANGATLTVEAGVVISFDAGTNLSISNGSLRARGTAGQPIIFTSTIETLAGVPAPGNWGQINFLDGSNDTTTIIEHAQIRYGKGISVQSAAPTFNYLQVTQNQGSAISIDLNSSPKGIGNQASGNTLNGISVPAGDLVGNITWGIKGIPYVVASGTVSVGVSPTISALNPAEIQQSQSIDAVITGTRLSGVESVLFEAAGVIATLSAGASDTSIPVHISASANQPLGQIPYVVKTPAGSIRDANGINVISLKPTIAVNSIAPGSMRRAETRSFQISGNYLTGAQITPPAGGGLTVSNLLTTDTLASFNLTSSTLATLGTQALTVTNPAVANGSGAMLVTINTALPKIDTTLIPGSVPPDSITRQFQLTLSNADSIDHSFNLSTVDPTIISVSPTSVTIPAGSTTATINITGLKFDYTILNITSTTVLSVSKQILSGTVGPMVSPVISVEVPNQPNGLISSSVNVIVPGSAGLANSIVSPLVSVEVPGSAQLPNSIVSSSVSVEVPGSAQLPNSIVSSSVSVEVPGSAQLPNSIESPSVSVEVPGSALLPNSILSSTVTVDTSAAVAGPLLSPLIIVDVP